MNEPLLPRVAVIVLTWNQRDLTLDCLASLQRSDYPSDRLQIIVVDNGSADDTAAAVHERFASVTVIENGANLGFAEGNDVGLRHALRGPADYLMLLNNDTVVDPAMLSHLIAYAQAAPEVGIVTPKILYHDEPGRIWCAGNSIDWRRGTTLRLRANEPDDSTHTARDVDYATGCAICWKRQAVEQTGLLDSRFFIYYEETDWCVRARRAGWSIHYVPTARMWHRVSAAMGTSSPATDYYMARNVQLFLAKNLSGLARARAVVAAATRTLSTIAAYTLKPHGGARLPHRNARLLALRDAALGRWGKMGADVEAQCHTGVKS
ncbi:MAG: glycosyltransferase family 2 protein [Chloroflexi bacterium]|nr:glycosyltransferase family 2 protein [Chloroflexota bacterium]